MSTAVAVAEKTKVLVRLTDCVVTGGNITGVFPLLGETTHSTLGKMFNVMANDQSVWAAVGAHGTFEYIREGDDIVFQNEIGVVNVLSNNSKMTEAQVDELIAERFEVMDALVKAMIVSRLNSVIITGAAGIGKTFNVEQILEDHERAHGQHWMMIGGRCSPSGLYQALWSCRNEGSILVLDDVEVWDEDDSLNILKKALDTTKRRTIDWRTASKALEDKGIPNSFEFKGKVIFLTNVNAYHEITRGTKKAPHLNALISRSVLIDLAIHDVRTIFLHVRRVVRNSDMLIKRGVTAAQQDEIIEFIHGHLNQFPTLSLRTPLMIAEFMLTMPDMWRKMTKNTLLKPQLLNW